jgi:alkylation response protein AidB-like acyl-CoA dehydrogenase
MAGPFTLHAMAEEIMCGANTAFNMYPALTQGVADVIQHFGTKEQIAAYCTKLHDGTYAGDDVPDRAARRLRRRQRDVQGRADGRRQVQDPRHQDLHLGRRSRPVEEHPAPGAGRTEDAPAGTKGLSLFIVPRDRADGTSNDVKVASLEHKMGIKASATAVLNFGDDDNCIGELVGTEEQKGMSQMFHLMNYARIGVGVQGLAVASSAYLNALEYAKERKQGPSIKQWKDAAAPRVAIIDHPDVRRMLLDMKARVEGIRALVVKLSLHLDKANAATGDATPTPTTRARSTCWCRWSRPTARTRRSRCARPRSRRWAARAT